MTLVLAAAAAFAATNVDDLVLLAVLFAVNPRPREVWAGQSLGFAVLVAVSAAGALGATLTPEWVVRGLGLVPLLLGLRLLLRPGDDDDPVLPATGVLGIAGITITNGADNIAVYVPLFASADVGGMPVVLAVFAAGVVVWCVAGRWLGARPTVERTIARHGRVLVPLVFVALGAAILGGFAG